MVPEIKSETDRIFCHLGPFFALLPLLHPPSPPPPPPTPPNDPEIKILKKKKKKAVRYYPFIHTCVP